MNILSNVIVDLLGYNNPEERDIYKYGVQILLSDLSNFLIIIVPSLIFNKLSEGIVFWLHLSLLEGIVAVFIALLVWGVI